MASVTAVISRALVVRRGRSPSGGFAAATGSVKEISEGAVEAPSDDIRQSDGFGEHGH
jgi:hypothetical protein